jgi:PTS system fructose-specific IIC component
MKIVAVTSCPTGIAHTYMAAEALEQAAKDAGHEIKVETQGAAGAEAVADADIAGADAVVFAADVEVRNRERFAGKPLVQTSVKRAINDADGLIAAPEGGGAEHMGILASLARRLIHQSFKDALRQAPDPEAVDTLVKKEVLGQ